MHDAEHKDHVILVDDVVHHPEVADTEPVKRVSDALDCPDRLAPNPTRLRSVFGEPFERLGDPGANLRWRLRERLGRGGGQLDSIQAQPRSLRLVVRPTA